MQKLLYLQALVLLITAFLDIQLGINQMYFWRFSWFDIPMHILGGLWAGLFCAWLASFFGVRLPFRYVVLGAFCIGAGWEIFEYVNHIGGSIFMSYRLDTAKDLLDDVIGGALAGAVISRL